MELPDLKKAADILREGLYTCVLCKQDVTYTSVDRGVSPMVGFLAAGKVLTGFAAADKVVGKAAAMLFVLAGVEAVYAEVISQTALQVLQEAGVIVSYRVLTDWIINRDKSGPCPMEQAVINIHSPVEAYQAIVQKLKVLKKDTTSF